MSILTEDETQQIIDMLGRVRTQLSRESEQQLVAEDGADNLVTA